MSNWIYVTSLDKLEIEIKQRLSAQVIALDTETTGLDPHTSKIRLIQIAVEARPTLVIDYQTLSTKANQFIQNLMDQPSVKVFQNAKFDINFLRASGIEVKGKLFDTMLAGQLLRTSGGIRKASLTELCLHYLDLELPKEEQTSDFSGSLTDSQLTYAAKDAEVLVRLRNVMIELLKKNNLVEVARLEFASVYAVASMEYHGIHLDLDRWKQLTLKVESQRDQALQALYPYIGYPTVQLGLFEEQETNAFNLNSNKQVLELLKKHDIHLDNTSRHALAPYFDHPIVHQLLIYRTATKALNTFLHPLPELMNPITHRLHPHYSQNGAHSGRMSCGNPNIQQIPRELAFRSCFTSTKGRKLVIADYSQIELRVIAEFTGDLRMVQAYKQKEDLHRLTASLVLDKKMDRITKEERQAAKAVNFGLVFGMGAKGLQAYAADTYGTHMTLDEAELFKKRFFQAYKGVDRWHKIIKQDLPRSSRTLSGRKHNYGDQSGMSTRYNTPIQGTAADILKNALGMLYNNLYDRDVKIIAVIHDEIILECPEVEAKDVALLLSQTMEKAGARYLKDVPVEAESTIANSWAGK